MKDLTERCGRHGAPQTYKKCSTCRGVLVTIMDRENRAARDDKRKAVQA